MAGFGGPGEPKAVKAAVGYIHFAILTEAGQVCGPSSVAVWCQAVVQKELKAYTSRGFQPVNMIKAWFK